VLTGFLNLPMPVKLGLMMLSGGGIIYFLLAVWPGPPAGVVAVFVLAFAGFALVGYRWLLKRMDKGKSTPFLQRLKENNSAAPSAVNDPSARARLDDLRRRFEEGIQTFKDHGKDLYSVPWYALVGEPGSGKTEAIRHCNVGFPPGLQDQLQGAGGTLNMNWWFTMHAVILDTAGRLMFEDVEPGATNEWKEFLRLLRQARPNCPINGMLLVIPADSLIKDSANDIEQKGGKIAEQLDAIQRALGVRFPVFIIITKSDLINGFREFFEGLTDPVLQHQMLGWSNPNPLDEPFKPEDVEKHLETVRERLLRRRRALLVDPTVTGEGSQGRLDDVDSLYAFPESIGKLGPRLRRYLEMVFVAGEWSQKPLFLRGIYFTSSMRQGEPLDAELAEALGTDIGNLPEVPGIKPRDISYFLKDMFMEKVFRERGLVTRAANTNKVKQQRQLIALGGGAALIAITVLLTWFGARELSRGVGEREAFWAGVQDLASQGDDELALLRYNTVEDGYRYVGRAEVELARTEEELSRVDLQVRAFETARNSPDTPLIFRPMTLFVDDAFARQEAAQRALFETAVLRPALDASRTRLDEGETPEGWTPAATAALAELLRLETAAAGKGSRLPALEDRSPIDLDALYAYSLPGGGVPADDDGLGGESEYGQFRGDADELQDVLDGMYRELGSSWPPSTVGAGTEASADAVRRGVRLFVESWGVGQAARPGTLAGELRRVVESATGFRAAESRLLRSLPSDASATPSEIAEGERTWALLMTELRGHKAELDAGRAGVMTRMGRGLDAPFPDESMVVSRAREEVTAEAGGQYDLLLSQLPELDELDEDEDREAPLIELRERLERGQADLEQAVGARVAEVRTSLGELRQGLLDAPLRTTTGRRGYEARFAVYDAIDGLFRGEGGADAPALEELAAEARAVERRIADAAALSERVRTEGEGVAAYDNGAVIAERALLLAGRRQRGELVRRSIDLIGGTTDLESWVSERARSLNPIQRPSVPSTRMDGGSFDAAYHPEAAGDVLSAYAALRVFRDGSGGSSSGLGDPRLASDYDEVMARCDAYLRAYARYWAEDVIAQASFNAPLVWAEYLAEVNRFRTREAMDELGRLIRAVDGATERVPEALRGDVPALVEVRARIAADRRTTADGSFLDQATTMLREIGDLPTEVSSARQFILAQRPLDIQQRYLRVYRDDAAAPAESYWSSVVLEGFRLLAGDSQRKVNEARQQLANRYRAFPLCLDADTTLSRDELDAALEHVALLADGVGTESAEGGGSRLSDGFFGGLPDGIAEELRRVRGDESGLGREDRAWVRRLARVATLFTGDDPLEWELLVLGSEAHTDGGFAAGTYRYMQAAAGRQPVSIDGAPRTQTEFWVCETDAVFGLPQINPVRVSFSRRDRDAFEAVAEFDPVWGAFTVLRAPDAEPIEIRRYPAATPACEGLWRHDVPLADEQGQPVLAGGQPVVYSFGVRFSRPVPDLREWPKVATWPR